MLTHTHTSLQALSTGLISDDVCQMKTDAGSPPHQQADSSSDMAMPDSKRQRQGRSTNCVKTVTAKKLAVRKPALQRQRRRAKQKPVKPPQAQAAQTVQLQYHDPAQADAAGAAAHPPALQSPGREAYEAALLKCVKNDQGNGHEYLREEGELLQMAVIDLESSPAEQFNRTADAKLVPACGPQPPGNMQMQATSSEPCGRRKGGTTQLLQRITAEPESTVRTYQAGVNAHAGNWTC